MDWVDFKMFVYIWSSMDKWVRPVISIKIFMKYSHYNISKNFAAFRLSDTFITTYWKLQSRNSLAILIFDSMFLALEWWKSNVFPSMYYTIVKHFQCVCVWLFSFFSTPIHVIAVSVLQSFGNRRFRYCYWGWSSTETKINRLIICKLWTHCSVDSFASWLVGWIDILFQTNSFCCLWHLNCTIVVLHDWNVTLME